MHRHALDLGKCDVWWCELPAVAALPRRNRWMPRLAHCEHHLSATDFLHVPAPGRRRSTGACPDLAPDLRTALAPEPCSRCGDAPRDGWLDLDGRCEDCRDRLGLDPCCPAHDTPDGCDLARDLALEAVS